MTIDRHKLRFGPYNTPRFKYGAKVVCEVRGEVTIVGMTDGRIQWPLARRGRGNSSPVLYKDLVRAVKREAACAIKHWWGVGASTVNKWRRALGVLRMNEGDRLLKRDHAKTDWAKAARAKAWAKARDPERRAKIAAAMRGKPRPPHVHQSLLRANKGRKLSAEHRQKLSAAARRRSARPPAAGRSWAAWEDTLLKSLPPAEVAKRTGRTLAAVFLRRHKLHLPDGRTRRERWNRGRSQ